MKFISKFVIIAIMNIPKCECGCGLDVSEGKNGWNRFVHGHHAKGRRKSEEEKRKIGEKNSINMKRFMEDNCDISFLRGKQLRSTWTEEREKRRVELTKVAYASMSPEEKQKFSDHSKKLWYENKEKMLEAAKRGGETFKKRAKEGLYDLNSRNDQISKSITQRYIDGGFEWSKGEHISKKTSKRYYYRSSWEKRFMEILDDDPNIEMWEYEFDHIEYEMNGKRKRYVPDFHIVTCSKSHILVEVKPESLRTTDMNDAKRKAAIEYCKRKNWVYLEWKPGDPHLIGIQ